MYSEQSCCEMHSAGGMRGWVGWGGVGGPRGNRAQLQCGRKPEPACPRAGWPGLAGQGRAPLFGSPSSQVRTAPWQQKQAH